MSWESFVRDEDGHWYLIPEEKRERFDALLESGDHNTFNREFGSYMSESPIYYKMKDARSIFPR